MPEPAEPQTLKDLARRAEASLHEAEALLAAAEEALLWSAELAAEAERLLGEAARWPEGRQKEG
jgi:hypothetical protein